MNFPLPTCLSVFLPLTLATALIAPCQAQSLNVRIGQMLQAKSPDDFRGACQQLFDEASATQIELLVADSNGTIALAAGWERVRRTIPREESANLVPVNRVQLSRFVGLVEGRTRLSAPPLWAKIVQSAESRGRHSISFDWFPDELPSPRTSRHDLEHNPAAPVHRRDDQWIVTALESTWTMPYTGHPSGADQASVQATTDTVYIAPYHSIPMQYTLHAIDRHTRKVRWSAPVWAAGGGNYTGQHFHYAEIIYAHGTVIVFGVTTMAAYVEILDPKSGRSLGRFGTRYFDRR